MGLRVMKPSSNFQASRALWHQHKASLAHPKRLLLLRHYKREIIQENNVMPIFILLKGKPGFSDLTFLKYSDPFTICYPLLNTTSSWREHR